MPSPIHVQGGDRLSREIIFESQTLSGFALNSELGFYTYEINPAPFSVTADQVYTVSWDETDHICYSFESNGSIVLGNSSPFGLCDTHEPFTIQYTPSDAGGSIALYSTQEAESHDVCVYAGVADDVEGIVLYNIDGLKRIHHGIDTLTVDTTTPDKVQTFTKGVVADPGEINIELNFQNGDHEYEAPDGILIKTATIKKPADLKPENIPEGLYIAGVGPGEFKGGGGGVVSADLLDGKGTTQFELTDTMFDRPLERLNPYAFQSNLALTAVDLSTILTIPDYAFNSCSNLAKVSLAACETIGSYAFASNKKVSELYLPECVSIGSWAFTNNILLTSLYLPKCVTLSPYAFFGCFRVSSVYAPECRWLWSTTFDAATSASKKYSSVWYTADMALSASSTFSGRYCSLSVGTRVIAGGAFSGKSSMYGVSQRDTVQYIGSYAFCNCSKMKSASFSRCMGIGDHAFAGCTSMSTINMPLCSWIGSGAFYNCYRLVSARLPNATFSTLGSQFYNCYSLTTVVLSACSSLTWGMFQRCSRLTSLYLLSTKVVGYGYNCLSSTPLSNYTTILGKYGSIFTRESLVSSYLASASWALHSARFVGLTDDEVESILGD